MFYVLRFVLQCVIMFGLLIAAIFAWKMFKVRVIHDGAWRGPLTQSHIYSEKWYRTDYDDTETIDPIEAIYTVLINVISSLLTFDIPEDCDLRLDKFLADQLVSWINGYGYKYGISSPAIVFGKFRMTADGKWEYIGPDDYAIVTCVMDLDRYGLTGMTNRVCAIDFLYPYNTLYPDITKDYKITRKFLKHVWSHLILNEYTITLIPTEEALAHWTMEE